MSELIAKLEAATEGSRELDCLIWCEINGRGQKMATVGLPDYDPPRYFCNPSPEINWIGYDLLNNAPHYTSKLDDAVALVPKGMPWLVRNKSRRSVQPDKCFAHIETSDFDHYVIESGDHKEDVVTSGKDFTSFAHTEALALCAASLKAMAKD